MKERNIPRPIILNIILLDLLHVVIRLGPPQTLAELPGKVPGQTEDRERGHLEPEGGAAEHARDDAKELDRDADLGRDDAVDGDKHNPNGEAARDGDDVVLRPVVGDQRGLAQDRQKDRAVHGRAPDPLASGVAVLLDAVVDEEEGAADVEDDGVVDGIDDPRGEGPRPEEPF